MLYLIGKLYFHTFLRLFSSHIVLLSIGSLMAGLLSWWFLPRFWEKLPHDHGKALVPGGQASRGKPTGAGIILAICLLPPLVLVVPPDFSVYGAMASLYLMMLFGYLDDKAAVPWGQLRKGILDTLCCLICAVALYFSGANHIWLPFTSKVFTLPAWMFLPVAVFILEVSVNALNCSDGVDGLAGSLGIMSLLSLSVLLYLVLGYKPVADYLLLPHYPDSAKWAILTTTISGAFAGYLWYNAEPSKVLMGDAGSRMLGLAIGVAVLAAGNPLLIFVFAPVVFANGGTGLVKILLLRLLKKFGFDTTPSNRLTPEVAAKQSPIVRELHSVRFPLHDHCIKNKNWSRPQVLMRFMLLQALLIPILFAIFTKVR